VTDPFLNTGRGSRAKNQSPEPFVSPSTPASVAAPPGDSFPPTSVSSGRGPLIAVVAFLVLGVIGVLVAVVMRSGVSDDGPGPKTGFTPTSQASLPAPPPPVAPGEVTRDDRLPAALPLPEGALAAADESWLLGVYTLVSDVEVDGSTVPEVGPNVVYLSSPEGDLFQVLELSREFHWRLNYWDASSNEALFGKWDPDHTLFGDDPRPPDYVWIDLTTGTERPADLGEVNAEYLNYLGTATDGRLIWLRSPQQPGEPPTNGPQQVVVDNGDGTADVLIEYDVGRYPANFALSPDHTRIAVGSFSGQDTNVITIATGETATFAADDGSACADGDWYDDATLVSVCFDGVNGSTFSVAQRDSSTGVRSDPLATGLRNKLSPLPLGYSTGAGFVMESTQQDFDGDACGVPEFLTPDGLSPVVVPASLQAAGIGYSPIGGTGEMVFLIGSACADSRTDTSLVAVDMADGAAVTRFPVAVDTADAHVTLGFTSLSRARHAY